jgi:hypothetical protein
VDRERVHGGGSPERDRPAARARQNSSAVARDEEGDEAKPRGAHRSTSGGGEAAQRRWRMVAA